MNKTFKKLITIVLSVAMLLGMSVMAAAATMTVHIRTYNQSTGEFTYPVTFDILNVNSSQTLYSALNNGTREEGVTLTTSWTNLTSTGDRYLEALSVTKGEAHFSGENDNHYSNIEYDDDGNYVHGTWTGSSWMWRMADNMRSLVYPGLTLSDQHCFDTDFGIILSFDTSSFTW